LRDDKAIPDGLDIEGDIEGEGVWVKWVRVMKLLHSKCFEGLFGEGRKGT
jgi:hypothetical protein